MNNLVTSSPKVHLCVATLWWHLFRLSRKAHAGIKKAPGIRRARPLLFIVSLLNKVCISIVYVLYIHTYVAECVFQSSGILVCPGRLVWNQSGPGEQGPELDFTAAQAKNGANFRPRKTPENLPSMQTSEQRGERVRPAEWGRWETPEHRGFCLLFGRQHYIH